MLRRPSPMQVFLVFARTQTQKGLRHARIAQWYNEPFPFKGEISPLRVLGPGRTGFSLFGFVQQGCPEAGSPLEERSHERADFYKLKCELCLIICAAE
jgi:hypothetical protein